MQMDHLVLLTHLKKEVLTVLLRDILLVSTERRTKAQVQKPKARCIS